MTEDSAADKKSGSSNNGDGDEGVGNDDGTKVSRPKNAAVPITIPVPEGSMPSKVCPPCWVF